MFKKIYIEITNNCNLNCNFCIGNNRTKKFISKDEFDKKLSENFFIESVCYNGNCYGTSRSDLSDNKVVAPTFCRTSLLKERS